MDMYISDFLPAQGSPRSEKVPLVMTLAPKSGLVQLAHTANFDDMYRHYWYRSGTNEAMVAELKDIATSTAKLMRLEAGDVFIDIACNDGTLLSFIDPSVKRVGFDPAHNTYEEANKQNFDLFVNDVRERMVGSHSGQQESKAVVAFRKFSMVGGGCCISLLEQGSNLLLHFGFQSILPDVDLTLLVDGRVHEIPKQHRGRTVDGHRNGSPWIGKVETTVQFLSVIQAADAHSGVADLAINVGAEIGIVSIEGYRIECCREPFGRHGKACVMEATVGSLWSAFSCEHSGRIFTFALERVDASRVREFAGHILLEYPAQAVAPGSEAR